MAGGPDLVQNASLGANGFADASACARVCAPATPGTVDHECGHGDARNHENLDPPVVHAGNARFARDGQASSRGSDVR